MTKDKETVSFTPEVILAISTAIEVLIGNLFRDIEGMTNQELTAFITEQKRRQAEHTSWLRAQIDEGK